MSDAIMRAAEQVLLSMDQMLQTGEWYCARERADALRAALAAPQPEPAQQVGCVDHDGLVRIHAASETCDVCAPPAAPQPEPAGWRLGTDGSKRGALARDTYALDATARPAR